MRVEHKLAPAVAAFAQKTLSELADCRTKYLAALGAAKEIELESWMRQQALSQQLKLVEETEKLPRPLEQYRLNPDGTALVAEVPDPAPAARPEAPAPAFVNGAPVIAGEA